MIEVGGLAQGIGFRPFVHALAHRLELAGSVRNRTSTVVIEIEGSPQSIESFIAELSASSARHTLLRCERGVARGEQGFRIEASDVNDASASASAPIVVPADIATCDACLRELFDDGDRRRGHPFINCTQCGPRATIVRDMPYDRERTSMARFTMCARCRREHDDPRDRRFHAQPIACNECGPRLRMLDSHGAAVAVPDVIASLAAALVRGRIAAVKGVGGFHLMCDASRSEPIDELRRRKARPSKPFAVMVASLEHAARWAELDTSSRAALLSPERPIVLVQKRDEVGLLEAVAPRVATLGLMLPYTPLQHLLFGALQALGHDAPLVVTSANRNRSLIATDEREARVKLAGIADLFVTHDRPIELAYEDSVLRAGVQHSRSMPLRRARGYAPLPFEIGIEVATTTLAVGGHMKAVFALAQAHGAASHVVLSPCFGDLEGHDNYAAWARGIDQLERLLRMTPARIAHDLHLDYASSRYALQRCEAAGSKLERVAVQHHHAHMASCMLEHGLEGDVIGVCFDGTGLGEDGTLWGGEFLVGGYGHARRAAHLATIPLVGGDRAAREPWRVALAHALSAGAASSVSRLAQRVEPQALRAVRSVIERALAEQDPRSPQSRLFVRTSSMGRLFDAVAALLGCSLTTSYEGEAPMQLEALAARARGAACTESYPFSISTGSPSIVDAAPVIAAIDRELDAREPPEAIARRFHTTVVEMIAASCQRIAAREGLRRVVLSGGVFANALVTRGAIDALRARDLFPYAHERVPTNDGGLCFGQVAVAAHADQLARDQRRDSAPSFEARGAL
jgi:hydrogenase maturation protein HypF